jgi:hypothetical protein
VGEQGGHPEHRAEGGVKLTSVFREKLEEFIFKLSEAKCAKYMHLLQLSITLRFADRV